MMTYGDPHEWVEWSLDADYGLRFAYAHKLVPCSQGRRVGCADITISSTKNKRTLVNIIYEWYSYVLYITLVIIITCRYLKNFAALTVLCPDKFCITERSLYLPLRLASPTAGWIYRWFL